MGLYFFYICLKQEYEGERGGVLLTDPSYNDNVKFYCTVQINMLTSYVPNVKQKHFFNYFRPADSVKAGGYFFYAGKTLIGAF